MSTPDATALPQEEQEKILRSRFNNRRLMAWISFGFMIFWSTVIIFAVTVNPGADDAAEALSKVTALIGMIFTLFSAIVLGYFGVAAYEHGKVTF